MQESVCCEIAEFIAVLANPYRVRILCVLFAGEASVGEIARAVNLPPAHVSSHLRVLYDRGYVDRRREWKQVFYSLREPRIEPFLTMAASLTSARESSPTASNR
jgi:DNA-binding transcriptional ArsR family regulator